MMCEEHKLPTSYALVGGIGVLVAATVKGQPVAHRGRMLWLGVGCAVVGVVLAWGIGRLL